MGLGALTNITIVVTSPEFVARDDVTYTDQPLACGGGM